MKKMKFNNSTIQSIKTTREQKQNINKISKKIAAAPRAQSIQNTYNKRNRDRTPGKMKNNNRKMCRSDHQRFYI
jgi:hypothetical protein